MFGKSKASESSSKASTTSAASSSSQITRKGKEKAPSNKEIQEQALAALPPNKLFIVLHIRKDPPKPNDFHWSYYFHKDTGGGMKYHMTNLSISWIADHSRTGGVFKSAFLCVLIQIATVDPAKHSQLDQIMRSHDADVNSIAGVTCRVWVMAILHRLVQAGIVNCISQDLNVVETECMAIGNYHSYGASKNNQPRPVVVSETCH